MSVADPLAAALRVVMERRGLNYRSRDELAWCRRLRDVAQVCWMNAGEPERLRSEDADRAWVCRELARRTGPRGRALCLVPETPAPVRSLDGPTPRRRTPRPVE